MWPKLNLTNKNGTQPSPSEVFGVGLRTFASTFVEELTRDEAPARDGAPTPQPQAACAAGPTNFFDFIGENKANVATLAIICIAGTLLAVLLWQKYCLNKRKGRGHKRGRRGGGGGGDDRHGRGPPPSAYSSGLGGPSSYGGSDSGRRSSRRRGRNGDFSQSLPTGSYGGDSRYSSQDEASVSVSVSESVNVRPGKR